MIEESTDINQLHSGKALLHLAVPNLSVVQLLLDRGADASIREAYNGLTPLHMTSTLGPSGFNPDLIKLLLKHGANVNERCKSGFTPLLYALDVSSIEHAKFLLDCGADITAVTRDGETALHCAALNRDADMLGFALDQGFDIDCTDKNDHTALHKAGEIANYPRYGFLLNCGASISKKSSVTGKTPLTTAMEYDADFNGAFSKIVAMMMMPHLAKVKYFKSGFIDDRDLRNVESQAVYKNHYRACLSELHRMKRTKFYDDVMVIRI